MWFKIFFQKISIFQGFLHSAIFECYFFRKLRISDDLQKNIFLLTITLTISVLIAKVIVSKIYVFGKHFACYKVSA